MLTFEVLAVFVTGLAVTALITKFLGGVLLVLVRIIFALIFVCMWIYMVVWSDKRYWGGVKEFRADRIGFQVSGVNVDAVRNIGYFYIKYENMNATAKNSNDFHPPMERRVMEIEQNGNKKWGISDYIRFTLIFMKNKKWEAA
jgi:Zn-dependent protease with chaperone function